MEKSEEIIDTVRVCFPKKKKEIAPDNPALIWSEAYEIPDITPSDLAQK